ncbi:ferredoxin--NADP(+) reductase [Sodalis sp. CWE]|uniref:ferredoxin--NADP(+) reductase n=1 Tax=Sodalis sp. CWE TaxID=2803816 RepID=UPI001C7D7A85|nr:ferredoxin--NADP(+) reductase [Sodalis sp. CWE]MBX4180686.1 ferredoxin--NADP(+) reductase [Sodalis sp. CWE]
MSEWVIGNVVQVKHWTDNLFSLIIRAPIDPFVAGQFTKLGLEINGKKIQRAYSYVNAPKNRNLEFYLIAVPGGKFSGKLHAMQPGNNLMITKKAAGFFILDEIPSCKYLWMLATGTALGPYLSILEQGDGLERFDKIILIHAVRFAKELSYLPQMLKLQRRFNNKLSILTIVSREINQGSLTGRIPSLIKDGSLEQAINLKLEAKNCHVMLCGNPNMVHDTQQILKETRAMQKHFKNSPGHISTEHYW